MANEVPSLQINLPVGLFVSADLTKKRTVDMNGTPIADPAKHMFDFGLAVRKDNEQLPDVMNRIFQFLDGYYRQTGNQQGLAKLQNGLIGSRRTGQNGQTGLALKIKDGDLPNREGKVSDLTRGHIVFYTGTTLPIKTCNGMAANAEIDPAMIKRGFFCDVNVTVKPNTQPGDNLGIYINPNVVRLCGYGLEIVGGISINEAFGNVAMPTQLPPGASQTPLVPAGGMPGFTPPPSPGYQPQAMPGMPSVPQQPQAGSPYPNVATPSYGTPAPMPGYAPNAAAPQMPGGYVQTPVPSTAYPSNNGMPAGFPMPAPQPGLNPPSPTGYPINPATGQPVAPHPAILQPQQPAPAPAMPGWPPQQ